jgi:bilirubin oxidase
MPIPPILEPTSRANGVTTYDITAQTAKTRFHPEGDAVETFGYNGNLLGPTIRLRTGETVAVNIHNRLEDGQVTNVHWHGVRLPASADGPHNDIPPGESFTARFTVVQPAATLWYHPHWGNTGFQVYKGLAALLYVDDKTSDALPLPQKYGIDDVPLIIQDRSFYPDSRLNYMAQPQGEDHMLGDQMLVNGVVWPHLDLPRSLVRLRLLNGSNARRYNLAFEDGRTFYLIASDGGLLPAPVPVKSLMMAAAERAEILLDLSREAAGAKLKLVSLAFRTWEREEGPMLNVKGRVTPSQRQVGKPFPIMELRVAKEGSPGSVPDQLVPIMRIPAATAKLTRTFHLDDAGENTINGRMVDMHRADFQVDPRATEIWAVTNDAKDFAHTFHVHGVQMQVLDRVVDGKMVPLPPIDTGWKDTVLVDPQETVRLIGRFNDLEGLYMYHCHVLEHEDRGMMGTFFVGRPSTRANPSTHHH